MTARRITAPSRETRRFGSDKPPLVIEPPPSNGPSSQPPISAPTIPTTMFMMIPCWASVRMIRLASHPKTPPTIITIIRFIRALLSFSRHRHAAAIPASRRAMRDCCSGFGWERPAIWSILGSAGRWNTGRIRARNERNSVALLALVLVAILLDSRDPEARHAAAIDRALPAGKLLKAEGVALARLVDRQKATGDRGDDLGLAPHDPTSCVRRRRAAERQRPAKRADDLGRPDLLILKHSVKPA